MDKPTHKQFQLITKNIPFLVLGLALTLMYLSFYVFEAQLKIDIQTNSPLKTFFKVYWADQGQAYSESRMAQVQVDNQQQHFQLYIADLDGVERIRIDPVEYPAVILFREISISQFGYEPISFSGKQALTDLKILQQIQSVRPDRTDGRVFQTTGNDGQLELMLSPVKRPDFPVQHLFTLLMMLVLLALIVRYGKPLLIDLHFVPYLLGVGILLILVMSLTTGLHVHPDEIVHLSAVNYYANHLLPPPLDADIVAPTYSIYGHSRLSNFEIYYQLAGVFQHITHYFGSSAIFSARMFSLGLFAVLFFFSVRDKYFRIFALPIIVSAQIWYLFAYTNSDAFALTIAIIVSYLAAYPRSILNRFLTEITPDKYFLKLLGLGLLLGVLLLSKTNYYSFILFLGLYLLWRISQGHFPAQKRLWSRLALLMMVAGSLYGVRFAMDISANGWDRTNIITQMQEQYAEPPYKASTPLNQKNPMLNLRQQGESLGRVVITDRWFEKTFLTSFGVYGFTEYFAQLRFYDFVAYTSLLLLIILLIAALRNRPGPHLALLLIIGICASGLMFSIIWHSWNISFQAQGRYMMPIFPMLGVLYYHVRQHAIDDVVEWLSIALFGLAVYSFVFIGIRELNQLGAIF